MPSPRFAPLVVVGDDALLLAEITTLVARRSAYLPLLNGPRLQRPDRDHEVIRRANVIARVQPQSVLFAGLPDATCNLFSPFPRRMVVRRIQRADEVIAAGIANRRIGREPLYWSRSHVGVGVLQALRSHRRISFADMQPPRTSVGMESSHIVVCEDGDSHAQVIAAAYAFSIDAGLCVIPECPRDEADNMLEALYGLSEQPAPAVRLETLRSVLRAHIGEMDVRRRTLTFVTAKLPWGLAFPDVPSTHLFRYPDLGIAIVNGMAGEQDAAPGVRSAVVIAPHSDEAADARVHTGHERLTGVVAAGEMPSDHVVGDRQKATVRTLRALDARFFADAPHPLVGTRGCVAGLPRFPAFESTWIHVLASTKERSEQCDLFVRRRELMDETWTLIHGIHSPWTLRR